MLATNIPMFLRSPKSDDLDRLYITNSIIINNHSIAFTRDGRNTRYILLGVNGFNNLILYLVFATNSGPTFCTAVPTYNYVKKTC